MKKTDVLKTCRKSKLLGKKIWRNAILWKAKRCKVYSGKRLFWYYCLQLPNLFCSGDKSLLLESLQNEVDFRDIMNVFANILAKNQNFRKLRQNFVDERALITTTLISSCHWKTLVPFCLQKKYLKTNF